MKALLLLVFLLFNQISSSQDFVECDGKTINHCTKCNSGENSDSCAVCENKYFPFFNNLICLPCNDSIYGQIGCEGNCDGSNYIKTRNVFCEEGRCKEGFYNLNGICKNCSEGSPGCLNCTYEVQERQTKEDFICHQCVNNEYRLTEFGTCEHCKMDYCKICHYNENYTASVCDKCNDGYYINSNGECNRCYRVYINGGYCNICSDNRTDYDSGECRCDISYTLIGHSNCIRCNKGCSKCAYNNITKELGCLKCEDGYIFVSDKNCSYCGDGCESCYLNETNQPVCLSCFSGTFLDKNKCLICSNGCSKCIIDESSLYKNESVCTTCLTGYALNKEKNCVKCTQIEDIGGSRCRTCRYNDEKNKFECLSCYNSYDYVFIINTFQCFINTDPNQLYLYGCLQALYIEESNSYECLNCYYSFIQIINDKTCRKLNDIGISPDCLEVENLGTVENPIYSCYKCKNNTAHIKINSNGKKNCYTRSGNFSFCSEGEIDENGHYICSKCVENAKLNSSDICDCNSDSFGKYNQWCYKCDDISFGNPGCVAKKGCNYIHSNDELDCNECKEGYFEYTRGQCFSCSGEIRNCEKCHFDTELKCDNCIGFYSPSDEQDKCEIDECKEYPEISAGCVICKDKLDEYKAKKKCESCRYGYFKTKEETCVFCGSEKYGGPACYECGYEEDENGNETDNIICKDCYTYERYFDHYYYNSDFNKLHFISASNGKCYNCMDYLPESCIKCDLIKDNQNNDKFICTVCDLGYYLDSEGNCVSYKNNIESIPNCQYYNFNISNLSFVFYNYSIYYNYISLNSSKDAPLYINNFNIYNDALKNMNYQIKTNCRTCDSGYFLNNEGECEILNYEKCTGGFIIKNISQRLNNCKRICNQNNYLEIYLKEHPDNFHNIDFDFEDTSNITAIDINKISTISYILENIDRANNETKNFVQDMHLCLNILSDINLKNQFDGCYSVVYIPKTKTYYCYRCKGNYMMDPEKHLCLSIYNYNEFYRCDLQNIGNYLSPVYSCNKCNYYSSTVLITLENGVKICIQEESLENCLEADANTTYANTLYNCTSCKFNYWPYYSGYYGRKICQNIFEPIIKYRNISLEKFEGEEYILPDDKGICRKNYFTPDGKKCYKCDNKNFGLPGCKGECSFSLYRQNPILCEGVCKEGYIESSQGLCGPCENVNEGCNKCHYEDNYPINYIGIKRERRFVCDSCKDGFVLSEEGKCLSCYYDFKMYYCNKCARDEKSGKVKCIECKQNYFLEENGDCSNCIIYWVIMNDKCISCDDTNNGGVKGCDRCKKEENTNKIICKECLEDYILFSNNNTCIERKNNKELIKFDSCLELKMENGKLICLRCKKELTLLKTGNEQRCTYIPILYDPYFYSHLYDHYYYDVFQKNSANYNNYRYSYFNSKQIDRFPCKEAINLGTEESPLYSCIKCYNTYEETDYEYEYDDDSWYSKIKIIDETINNRSYCISVEYFENCTEAVYKISKGVEIYNCTKCKRENKLYYNKDLDINYCAFDTGSIRKCLVDYCKTCLLNNNYFCSSCITSDFEVNKYTGSCVKKTEIIPAVTWKDIYRLNMNGQKEINGQIIIGPSFNLRGITSSQINTRHAFLIYLTFKIKHSLRNLQEIIKIPALCEIKEEVEETLDYVNIVDYECIGNSTIDEDNYKLTEIEEDDDNDIIINGNLNEINRIINETDELNIKNKSDFTSMLIDNMVFFYINNDNITTINSSNNTFNICINGIINKQLIISNKKSSSLRHLDSECIDNIEIEINKINDKANCSFCPKEDLNASLACNLAIKNMNETRNLSFKSSEIKIEDSIQSIYIPELNKINLYYKKEITEEIQPIIEDKPKNKSSKGNNTLIIALSVVISVLVICGIAAILLYLLKFKKKKNVEITIPKIRENIKSNDNLTLKENI